MPSTILKRHPRLHTSRDSERSAVWLELFFDLVFVLAVAELARYLQERFTEASPYARSYARISSTFCY